MGRLLINSDSQLIVIQVHVNFIAKDKSMAVYLKLVIDLLPSFEKFELGQILLVENAYVDVMSKLANRKDSDLLTVVPIKHFTNPPLYQ